MREPVLVGEVAALTADITNFADTAAGPFTVEFFVDQPGEDDLIFDFQTIQGLAAGGATVLNVSITPDVVGLLGLIARVDPEEEVTETDESDNETILELSVVENEINLTLPADGLTVSSALIPEEPTAYLFTIALTNTGQSTLVGPMSVRYFGRTDAGQYVEWGTFDFEIDLAPGDLFNRLVGWSVDPGTYRAYALADSGEDWPEIIEDDNQAFVDFTAP